MEWEKYSFFSTYSSEEISDENIGFAASAFQFVFSFSQPRLDVSHQIMFIQLYRIHTVFHAKYWKKKPNRLKSYYAENKRFLFKFGNWPSSSG
jgi:hypothetical protein